MNKKFQKKVENFTCEKCKISVAGNGYTNHCPECLWSKHVDVNPGDRAALCQGMMEPQKVDSKDGEYQIIHRCVRCKYKKKNKMMPEDNFETMLRIAEKE